MIKERVTQEDLIVYEIFKNPILFSEFIANFDKRSGDEKFELTKYQREIMADFSHYVSLCTARAVGKTTTLFNIILWLLLFAGFSQSKLEDRYILFAVPNKVHLSPVWDNLIKFFRGNSIGKQFVPAGSGINSSDFTIKCLNGTSLYCRIAGQSGTGANVVGLHTPYILVDEAGYFPWGTFQEMQPVLNVWFRGHREIVAGVPTGLREKNVLYNVDQVDSRYSKHRVTAFENPRLTERDFQNFEETYNGRNTEDWIHYVLGQHGKPAYALFDRSNMYIENYPVYRVSVDKEDIKENFGDIIRMLSSIPNVEKRKRVILGIDLGFTEPTAIQVLSVDEHNILRIHARVKLQRVSYPVQEKIIDFLDSKFEPIIIGIDRGAGGQGISLIQHLQDDPQYYHKNYKSKIFPVEFGGNVVIGVDFDGKEISVKTKPHAVQLLSDLVNTQVIHFSTRDIDLISELEQMTYYKTVTGELQYRMLNSRSGKVEDHFTSALLCAILAYNLNENEIYRRQIKRLATPSWSVTYGG